MMPVPSGAMQSVLVREGMFYPDGWSTQCLGFTQQTGWLVTHNSLRVYGFWHPDGYFQAFAQQQYSSFSPIVLQQQITQQQITAQTVTVNVLPRTFVATHPPEVSTQETTQRVAGATRRRTPWLREQHKQPSAPSPVFPDLPPTHPQNNPIQAAHLEEKLLSQQRQAAPALPEAHAIDSRQLGAEGPKTPLEECEDSDIEDS